MTTSITLKAALHLARARFAVFPCRQGDKRPATNNGLLDATVDEAAIRRWFGNDREFNLAVACGPQPNGINLLAIDVDPLKGGDETWASLLNGHSVPPGPVHVTRSGGQHLFFDAPSDLHNTTGRLGAGIDTRGVGGYVVVPPSRVVDTETGVVGHYTATRDTILGQVPVPPLPEWLCEMLDDDDWAASEARHPSRSQVGDLFDLGDSVADRLRAHWVWEIELVRDGWVLAAQRGDEQRWTRPDKPVREGHSAVLHLPDGPFVVWTTERPPGGVTNIDGSSSFSPWEYLKAYRGGGDNKATAVLAYGIIPKVAVRDAGGDRLTAVSDDTPGDESPSWQMPMVPVEYWSASARNAHILAAAHAALVSPDALDLVMFAFESCLIPPGYLLPRIVGGQSPLNFLACLVAPTGMFKTATLDVARELMGPLPPWVRPVGMGSGEGVGQMFMMDEYAEDDKGKRHKTGRQVRDPSIQAVFFEADEGSGLAAQAERAGATIIPNLCKAWSGSTLGEANADPTKRRHVLDRDYRIAALVNIQPSNFAKLFSVQNTGTGLTGRFMFSGTTNPNHPAAVVEWPGRLEHPRFPSMPLTLTIESSILARCSAEAIGRLKTGTLLTASDAVAQNPVIVGRMAAIAVLVDGRRHITEADWAVAQVRADASAAGLRMLECLDVQISRDRSHAQAIAKAETEIVISDVKERRAIASMAENIRRKAKAAPTLRKLSHDVSSGKTRHRFDAALELAERNGWIKVDGDRVVIT